MPTSKKALAVTAFFALAPLLAGCGADAVCGGGQYPAYSVESPDAGYCEEEGTEPDEGFARYPEGREPESVGDEYDRWPLAEDYPWRDEVDPVLLDQTP